MLWTAVFDLRHRSSTIVCVCHAHIYKLLAFIPRLKPVGFPARTVVRLFPNYIMISVKQRRQVALFLYWRRYVSSVDEINVVR